MVELIICNGTLVRPLIASNGDRLSSADIAVDAGKIVAVGHDLGPAKEIIDATGLHVFSGVIDPHVHFNEPGRDEWEGVSTGSAAHAAGGGTAFFDMPLNSDPPVLTSELFDAKVLAASSKSYTDFALWGGLTPNNLDRLEELAERGVIGFKAFMSNSGIDEFKSVDDYTLFRGMQTAARLKLPVAVHAENDSLCAGYTRASIAAGKTSMADYLASRPVVAEVEAIRRAIFFAQETGCALHVVHVSSVEGLQAILEGRTLTKRDGSGPVDVTSETAPHYLLITAGEAVSIGPRAKCAPPVRDKPNRDALRKALRNQKIDMIGSDHSPAPLSMKGGDDAFRVWGGIAGVQSTLSGLLSLPHRPELSTIGQVTSGNVARRFKLASKGRIEPGYDADLALLALNDEFVLQQADLLDRHKLSPYVGRTFKGRVKRTLLRGRTIFQDGKISGPPGGMLLKPSS